MGSIFLLLGAILVKWTIVCEEALLYVHETLLLA